MLTTLNPSVLPLVAATFALVLAAVLVIWRVRPEENLTGRLVQYTTFASSPGLTIQTLSARQRLLNPIVERLLSLAAGTAPKRVRQAAVLELTMAGSGLSPTVFLGIRGLCTFGVPALALILVLSSTERSVVQWGVLATAVLLGRRLPGIWLKRQIRRRQRNIERAMPYALDLLVACLEGGLSLDSSLAKVAEQSSGALASEIRRTLQEMTLGRPSAEALRDLGQRTGSTELKRLVDTLIQADQMGISLSDALRTLAQDSRIRRRQRAEEAARKAPIKMMPVVLFFILPSVAGVMLAPAIINLGRVFSHLQQ
jgi:tight adherence protein C